MKNKIIKVNNDKELISFFRKLWLYKLQKNTLFILEEDIFGLNKIITALNIKNRKKRIEFYMMKHVSKWIIILKIKIYAVL